MLAVEDALRIVLEKARAAVPRLTALNPSALGQVLAEDVASDLDMPPFDKALMDGYALRCTDLPTGVGVLPIAGEVMAGQVAPALPTGHVIRIMTGAPIPAGADAVIQVEHSRLIDDHHVHFESAPPKPGRSILPQAREMKVGEVVLKGGTVLRPQELGLLASVGRTQVNLFPRAELAVLSTGNELVEAGERPGLGQLRNSNGPMLMAQAARAGASPEYLGIAPDHADGLRRLIERGLKFPVLVLSGGVSAGKLDLVPGVLRELGVEPHFHQVAMKPGKPLLFGTRGDTLVFGLPGNPMSTYCGFELFVRPALRRLAGHAITGPEWQEARLADGFTHRSDRPTYHPAVVESVGATVQVRAVAWFGSPDLKAMTAANCLMHVPAGSHEYTAGAIMKVLALS